MEVTAQYNEAIAALIVRVILGLLFLFQGYDAIFRVKVHNIIETYGGAFASKGIPAFLTTAGTWFTSLTELIGGSMLVLGLCEPVALCLLGANLLVASIAFSAATPMWDMKHVFPRLAMLVFLLLAPVHWNILSIDHILANIK
ncbi:MAG: DoxX family protein [Bacteroidia bacterium]